MVLLVAHKDVGDEGTLTRQKRDRKLYGLSVPVFAILPLVLYSTNRFVQLVQKPELGAHAEIGNGQEA